MEKESGDIDESVCWVWSIPVMCADGANIAA